MQQDNQTFFNAVYFSRFLLKGDGYGGPRPVAMKYLRRNKSFVADAQKYREFDESNFHKENIWTKITCSLLEKMVNPEHRKR